MAERKAASLAWTWSRILSSANTCRLAKATAQLTGCPANVMPCRKESPVPTKGSATRSLTSMAPNGE